MALILAVEPDRRQAANLAAVLSMRPKTELVIAEMDLDQIEEVRRLWQFYRDRRPETYSPMAEQLP